MSNVLLVYKEIPERTIILNLSAADLEAAKLRVDQIASIHGINMGSNVLSKKQETIHSIVHEAIFGVYDEEAQEDAPALWEGRIIFRTDGSASDRAGDPPKIAPGTEDLVVIHTGFVL